MESDRHSANVIRLKAYVKVTKDAPPKIHNLVRLAEIAGLELTEKQQAFLRQFDVYNLEGRYGDAPQMYLNGQITQEKMRAAREQQKWLRNLLSE